MADPPATDPGLLAISGLDCFYGEVQVVYGLDLVLNKGEVLCLFGRNGAGKTTTLKAIMGLVPAAAGSIRLDGKELTRLAAHDVPKAGVAYVPQGRRLFADMTVAENIEIGLMARGKGKQTRENVLDLFPLLRERLKQRSGTLSGGEQQMLAMARALCLEPQVLLLDEPTEGLMPSMIAKIRETVAKLNAELNGVLGTQDMKERFAKLGTEVRTGTPEFLGTWLRDEQARWARVVKESGAKFE